RVGLLVGADHDERFPDRVTHDRSLQLATRAGIEVRQGLIEKKASRPAGEGRGEERPGLLPRAQALGRTVTERRERERAERLLGSRAHLARGDRERLEAERDLGLHRVGKKLRVGLLEESRHGGPERPALVSGAHLFALEEIAAVRGLAQAREDADQGGLAGTVRAEEEMARAG